MESVKYSITIPDATKDGDIIIFSVQTKTNVCEDSERGKVVARQYEDFEYLLHCLTIKLLTTAVVVPPLPPKPVVLPAESKAKVSVSGTIYGDEYLYDCKRLQRFIQDIADHPSFEDDEQLAAFLTEEEPPSRAPVKKGLLNSFVSMVDNARFMNFKDVDEDFQEKRDGIHVKLLQTRTANAAKNRVLVATNDFASAFGNLGMQCRSSFINLDARNSKILTRFFGQFSEILDDYKLKNQQVFVITNETVGFTLELYSRYLQACQEMLFGRTCRMVEADSATKALEKAKPKNRDQLESAKADADREFEKVSILTNSEFEKFTERRVLHFKEGLTEYAERRLKHHTEASAALSKGINDLKCFL